MEPFDLDRLRDIPDPYAAPARAPVRVPTPAGMPASPSRAQRRSRQAGALAASVVVQVLALVLFEHRADIGVASRVGLAFGLGFPLVAFALTMAGATRKGGLGLGESAARLGALVAVSLTVFIVGTLLGAPADTEAPARFWSHAATCMAITSALAAAPLALGVWALRGGFVTASAWRGACLGTAAGALAAATMSLLCSTDGAGHVLLGHGLMMGVGAAAGAVLGRKVMRA
jgi:hypothetical protein